MYWPSCRRIYLLAASPNCISHPFRWHTHNLARPTVDLFVLLLLHPIDLIGFFSVSPNRDPIHRERPVITGKGPETWKASVLFIHLLTELDNKLQDVARFQRGHSVCVCCILERLAVFSWRFISDDLTPLLIFIQHGQSKSVAFFFLILVRRLHQLSYEPRRVVFLNINKIKDQLVRD